MPALPLSDHTHRPAPRTPSWGLCRAPGKRASKREGYAKRPDLHEQLSLFPEGCGGSGKLEGGPVCTTPGRNLTPCLVGETEAKSPTLAARDLGALAWGAKGHPFPEAIRKTAPAWTQPGTQAPGVPAQPLPQLRDRGQAPQTLWAQPLLHESQGETSKEKTPDRPPPSSAGQRSVLWPLCPPREAKHGGGGSGEGSVGEPPRPDRRRWEPLPPLPTAWADAAPNSRARGLGATPPARTRPKHWLSGTPFPPPCLRQRGCPPPPGKAESSPGCRPGDGDQSEGCGRGPHPVPPGGWQPWAPTCLPSPRRPGMRLPAKVQSAGHPSGRPPAGSLLLLFRLAPGQPMPCPARAPPDLCTADPHACRGRRPTPRPRH